MRKDRRATSLLTNIEPSKFDEMVLYRVLRASIFRNRNLVYLTEFVQKFKNTIPNCKEEVCFLSVDYIILKESAELSRYCVPRVSGIDLQMWTEVP